MGALTIFIIGYKQICTTNYYVANKSHVNLNKMWSFIYYLNTFCVMSVKCSYAHLYFFENFAFTLLFLYHNIIFLQRILKIPKKTVTDNFINYIQKQKSINLFYFKIELNPQKMPVFKVPQKWQNFCKAR